jgi:hypothetical protein
VSACVIDWEAFGLGWPGDIGCAGTPIVAVMQACEHEHIAAAKVCGPCLAEFLGYGEPGEWTCGPCLVLGHQCMAPLTVTDLTVPSREVIDRVLGALVDQRMPALPELGSTP